MSINYDLITTELVRIAVDFVGSELSTQPLSGGGTRPSVIKSRLNPKANKPDLPYVVIDVLDTQNASGGGWLNCLEFDPTDDSLNYEVDKNIFFRFTVYDKDQWKSNKIIDDLHSAFNFESVLQRLRDVGCAIKNTDVILSLPEPLSTNFQGVSAFDLTIGTKDKVKDTTNGVFDSIEGTGQLLRYENDVDPLIADINAPELETYNVIEDADIVLNLPSSAFTGWGGFNIGLGVELPVKVGIHTVLGVYTDNSLGDTNKCVELLGDYTDNVDFFPGDLKLIDDLHTYDFDEVSEGNNWTRNYDSASNFTKYTSPIVPELTNAYIPSTNYNNIFTAFK